MRWVLALWMAAALVAVPTTASRADEPATLLKATDRSFSRPHDLVLSPDRRLLYVADVGNHVVRVLDPASLETLGRIGEGDLASPHDVTFDREGRLLVADTGNDRIVVYRLTGHDLAGERTAVWTSEMGSPEGVAAAPDGEVFVTNASLGTVIVLREGRVVRRLKRVAGRNLSRPHDIHIDRQGRVFAVDPGNERILVLDGSLHATKVLKGSFYGFNEPKYVATDDRNRVFVADEYNNRILFLDGNLRPAGEIKSGLNQPEGVEVLDDRLWVSDTYNDRILLYKLK